MIKKLLVKSGVILTSMGLLMDNNWAMINNDSEQSSEIVAPLTREEFDAIEKFIKGAVPIQLREESQVPVREYNERYPLSYTSICGAKKIVHKLERFEKISLSQDQNELDSFFICVNAASGFNSWSSHRTYKKDPKDENLEFINEMDSDGGYTIPSKVRYNIKNKSLSGIQMEQEIEWDEQEDKPITKWVITDTQEITLYKIKKAYERLRGSAIVKPQKKEETNDIIESNAIIGVLKLFWSASAAPTPLTPASPIGFAKGGPQIYSKPPKHFQSLMMPGVLTGKEDQVPTQYAGRGRLTDQQLRTFEQITKNGFQFNDMEWSNRPASKFIVTVGGSGSVTQYCESMGFDEKTILQLVIDWQNYWENPTLHDGFFHLWSTITTVIPTRRLGVDTLSFLTEWTEEEKLLFMNPLAAFTTICNELDRVLTQYADNRNFVYSILNFVLNAHLLVEPDENAPEWCKLHHTLVTAIRNLWNAIHFQPQKYRGLVYRGTICSSMEISMMAYKKRFFIPGFVSTSMSEETAYWVPVDDNGVGKTNVMYMIDTSKYPDYTTIIQSHQQTFAEKECLIGCYNYFEFKRSVYNKEKDRMDVYLDLIQPDDREFIVKNISLIPDDESKENVGINEWDESIPGKVIVTEDQEKLTNWLAKRGEIVRDKHFPTETIIHNTCGLLDSLYRRNFIPEEHSIIQGMKKVVSDMGTDYVPIDEQ